MCTTPNCCLASRMTLDIFLELRLLLAITFCKIYHNFDIIFFVSLFTFFVLLKHTRTIRTSTSFKAALVGQQSKAAAIYDNHLLMNHRVCIHNFPKVLRECSIIYKLCDDNESSRSFGSSNESIKFFKIFVLSS